jgi:hypothetical protein
MMSLTEGRFLRSARTFSIWPGSATTTVAPELSITSACVLDGQQRDFRDQLELATQKTHRPSPLAQGARSQAQ